MFKDWGASSWLNGMLNANRMFGSIGGKFDRSASPDQQAQLTEQAGGSTFNRALIFLRLSILLFYAGVAFAYFVAFPLIFGFFTGVAPQDITIMTDINSYLDFVLRLFFAFGLAFEVTIAVILLIWAGVTTPQAFLLKRY